MTYDSLIVLKKKKEKWKPGGIGNWVHRSRGTHDANKARIYTPIRTEFTEVNPPRPCISCSFSGSTRVFPGVKGYFKKFKCTAIKIERVKGLATT